MDMNRVQRPEANGPILVDDGLQIDRASDHGIKDPRGAKKVPRFMGEARKGATTPSWVVKRPGTFEAV